VYLENFLDQATHPFRSNFASRAAGCSTCRTGRQDPVTFDMADESTFRNPFEYIPVFPMAKKNSSPYTW
jgi:hypothetical protein